MSRLMSPHMHQEGIKKSFTHIIKLSGGSGQTPGKIRKWLETSCWLGGGAGVRAPAHCQVPVCLELPSGAEGRCPWASSPACPEVGQRGNGGMGLESCWQTKIKNGTLNFFYRPGRRNSSCLFPWPIKTLPDTTGSQDPWAFPGLQHQSGTEVTTVLSA